VIVAFIMPGSELSSPLFAAASSPTVVSSPAFPPSMGVLLDDDELHAVASATPQEMAKIRWVFLMARPSAPVSGSLMRATLPDKAREDQSIHISSVGTGRGAGGVVQPV
jgi:hypothetical protein